MATEKFIPAVYVGSRMSYGVKFLKYKIQPLYTESNLTISDNTFGVTPLPLPTKRIIAYREIDVEKWLKYDERKRRQKKLSGKSAAIYGIVNPIDNKLFYIGSTKTQLKVRLWHHIRYMRINQGKAKILKAILQENLTPVMIRLCKCPAEFQFIEERRWIEGAKKAGIKLTNIQCYHA